MYELSFFDREIKIRLYREGYAFDGDSHLGIDGIDGDVQYFRDLPVLKAIFSYQLEDHFAAGRQCFHGLLDLLMDLGGDEDLFGGTGRVVESDMNMVKGFGDALAGLLG